MNYNQEYMSGAAALKAFLEKFFVVFTVGILFVFVLLRSEVMADVSPKGTVEIARHTDEVSEGHGNQRVDNIDLWLGRFKAVPSRGQGEN